MMILKRLRHRAPFKAVLWGRATVAHVPGAPFSEEKIQIDIAPPDENNPEGEKSRVTMSREEAETLVADLRRALDLGVST